MPPYKKPSSVQRKTHTEQAIASAVAGVYNTIIPLLGAVYCYIHHPVNTVSLKVKVLSPHWDEVIQDLVSLGMLKRINDELIDLAISNVDANAWRKVSDTFREKYENELSILEQASKALEQASK